MKTTPQTSTWWHQPMRVALAAVGTALLGLFAAYLFWISAPTAYDQIVNPGGSASVFAVVVAICLAPGCGLLYFAGRHFPAVSLLLFMAGFAILVTRAMQLLPAISSFSVRYTADHARLADLRAALAIVITGAIALMAFALFYLFCGTKIEQRKDDAI